MIWLFLRGPNICTVNLKTLSADVGIPFLHKDTFSMKTRKTVLKRPLCGHVWGPGPLKQEPNLGSSGSEPVLWLLNYCCLSRVMLQGTSFPLRCQPLVWSRHCFRLITFKRFFPGGEGLYVRIRSLFFSGENTTLRARTCLTNSIAFLTWFVFT